ncbi:unnamed protein product [Symbiodinium necroappetens]|uniref:Uncharacterized protein n=1 Tax=Symbiodinium necroappetens TaxID=1628268 RepID=A0A813C220_9DINO|nr:unnamed protein product [Symbiodinium necroappetens]
MTAFLTELRRRARDKDELGKRFFCVIDSLVSFYVLGKGRSSSKRLNRVSRLIPMCLWTISKWNFSDGASYENAVAALFKYLNALRGRLPRTMAELDEELAEYINHLYQEGDAVTLAGWTLSGLKRFFPRCRPHLLTSQLFLRNWQRVHLPQRTSPMTWLGARAMAGAAYKVGRPDLALSIFLGFAFFLRTMELLSLTIRRGGATEYYQRTQSLGRTMVQGRWKDSQTARIYIDDARATLVQLSLSPPTAALQRSLASVWRVAVPGCCS